MRDIHDKIAAFHIKIEAIANHRYRSWEHCYAFFQKTFPSGLQAQREHAALELAFYLASWGMYRGSCFILQYDYTACLPLVDYLASVPERLRGVEFGSSKDHFGLISQIVATANAVRDAYRPCGEASDTLVTKVILGTLGCVPTTDRFFQCGFKARMFKYSYFNAKFMARVLEFSLEHLAELRAEQARIRRITGAQYPLMKLVDMYFWQIGYERKAPTEEVVV